MSYSHTRASEAEFRDELRRLVESDAKRFCEIGGGTRPLVPISRIEELGLEYVVLDESHEALGRTPAGYERFEASILDSDAVGRLVRERGPFDVAVSRWTAEHVPDGRKFHEQVYDMLRPGGTAIHFFPTLYSLPFLVNRLLPESVSGLVLSSAQPGRKEKFRSYYSWCRGPTARQIQRLESVGFSVDRYVGYFGHSYFAHVKPLHAANTLITEKLLEHPLPSMTTLALVVLSRPA
ncbi:MAG TPA: methyltransferase domain-containing protein [Solirubrobacteraceae bacterium]|nr:methyltransferase domain-containing protein [Solirubrobacteraceae bacterium]